MSVSFGQYLRTVRVRADLSLRQVADAVGISHSALGEVERGLRSGLKEERLMALERAIPGFSAAEARKLIAKKSEAIAIPISGDRERYRDLMLALARRVQGAGLQDREIAKIRAILNAEAEDD
jgi:transcriptional regulator with XRE-family HTH domain